MARENQGLHAALIVFVVLTILLAVTTFVFFSMNKEATKEAEANKTLASERGAAFEDKDKIVQDLKKLIGVAAEDNIEKVREFHAADMQKYASTLTLEESSQVYRQVVMRLAEVIQQNNESLNNTLSDNKKLEADLAALKQATDAQIEQYKQAAEAADRDKQAEMAKFAEARSRLTADKDRLAEDLQQRNKDLQTLEERLTGQIKELDKKLSRMTDAYVAAKGTVDKMRVEVPDRFHGKVVYANQRSGTVWIDLGEADGLRPQTKFSVFAVGTDDITEAEKKASIEVTRLLGPHMAEARVVEDSTTDPIMPRDRIYTPVWSLGERRHFALAGFIDVDHDGRDDLSQVRSLIEMNGGIVDAPMDAQGKRDGKLNMDTRYLVLGDEPGVAQSPGLLQDFNQMKDQAKELRVETIALSKFLELMGWTQSVQRASYTSGGADQFPVETKVKQPVSGGQMSDLFKPRKAPRGK